jgi:hypothetical protein
MPRTGKVGASARKIRASEVQHLFQSKIIEHQAIFFIFHLMKMEIRAKS